MVTGTLDKAVQQHTDAELVTAIVAGHTALFEIVIRRYNPFLYKVGRSYGFNHHDTEDLMQETFINSYMNLKQFAGRSSFKSWLIKIMLNQCYHKSRKSSYQKEQSLERTPENHTSMSFAQPNSDMNQSVLNKELNSILEACIQKLPNDYRTTFTLRELTGLSVAETADITHTTTANVKVRLNRAKALLRKEIEKVYTPAEIYEFHLIYCDRIVDSVMTAIHQLENQQQSQHS